MASSLSLLKRSLRYVTDHAPAILTAIGVAGTVSTTVLAVQATPYALRDISHKETEDGETLTKIEVVKLVWPHYVPATVVGGATIISIIAAQNINRRRQAAIMSLYTLTERYLNDYRAKVRETIGDRKETSIRESVAAQRIEDNPVSTNQVLVTGTGDNLCYDTFTGRYFKSDIESIRRAQNDINAEAINNQYASQNDFYRLIGLPPVASGEELGWRTDTQMDIQFSSHLSEDGKPCLSLDYRVNPIRGYWRMN